MPVVCGVLLKESAASPAGFAEGAQAGYEFGMLKSMLQVLAAQLAEGDSRLAKVGLDSACSHQLQLLHVGHKVHAICVIRGC